MVPFHSNVKTDFCHRVKILHSNNQRVLKELKNVEVEINQLKSALCTLAGIRD